jgi:uncharacterized membrane protein HdeD (DUF308 family)
MAGSAEQKSIAVPLGAFAAGAIVALLLGVFSKVHDPTLDGTTTLGFKDVRDMKVVVSTVIGVLAVGQLVGALWIYGKLGIRAPSWVGTAHRVSGAITLVLAVFVGYHCIWAFGFQTGTVHGYDVPPRAIVHEVLACVVFGAVVVKVVAVRSKRAPGWFLPIAGGLLFAALLVVVLTSAGWYLDEKGWPSQAAP